MKIFATTIQNIIACVGGSSSVLLNDNVVNIVDGASSVGFFLGLIGQSILKFFATIVLYMAKFALSVIDLVQVIVYKFLGITVDIQDYAVYDEHNPIVSFLTNDTVIKVLQTVFAIAIVLVIVFTIFSIIMGEYNKAANDEEYSVKRVWGRALKSIFGMTIFPVVFMCAILLINALLAGFSAVLSGNANMTMGSQVMATCTYNANAYRNYAQTDKRIPIYINFNDPYSDNTYQRYTPDELHQIYDAFATNGKEIYNQFASGNYNKFNSTLSYNSNTHSLTTNSNVFGEYEKFICTAEQYYVMADFIDYAMANNITFYYKSVTDEDIEWKYVDNTVYNKDTGSLTITYKDVNNLHDGNRYTVTYKATDHILSTPIEDALTTLKTLLGLDGTGFNLLDRINGSINKVEWAADKVKLQLSSNYAEKFKYGTATAMDQILLYEYYRYAYNNTLQNYTLNDLVNGIYLDKYTINCQYYRDYTASYVTLVSYDVVIINGHYYVLEQLKATNDKGDVITDSNGNVTYVYDVYGDPIYTIKEGYNATHPNEEGVGLLLSNMTYYNNTEVDDYNSKLESEGVKDPNAYKSKLGVCFEALEGKPWYSAEYSADGKLLPLNALHKFMADTVGRDQNGAEVGFADINGTKDENGSLILHKVERVETVKCAKKVDWATKLVGDLQTIYHNLNLSQLITTGEWLTIFNSNVEIVGNEYSASFDTSLISPQGLIFSELLLGNVVKSDGSNLGKYMFTSKYSSDEIKALYLALAGEEHYQTLKVTMDYFVDTFNKLFEPLLERIMLGEGQPFTEGEITSIQLYTYKAYLCSLFLSSDSASFFLDMAKEIVVMNQLRFDLLEVQTNDNNFVFNCINEYYKPSQYNASGTDGKIKFMFNIAQSNLDISKYPEVFEFRLSKDLLSDVFKNDQRYADLYLDATNKIVNIQKYPEVYRIYKNIGNITIKDSLDKNHSGYIDLEELPASLVEDIKKAAESRYYSFAELIIKENFTKNYYYGFDLNKSLDQKNDPIIDLIAKEHGVSVWGIEQKHDGTLGFIDNKIHSLKQLPKYKELCELVYKKVKYRLDNKVNGSFLVDVYLNINNKLSMQGSGDGSSGWPDYMVSFKNWLLGGTNDNLFGYNRLDIVLSEYVSTSDIQGIENQYNNYKKSLQKAESLLKAFYYSDSQKDYNKVVSNDFYLSDLDKLIDHYYANSTNALMTKEDLRKFVSNSIVNDINNLSATDYLVAQKVSTQLNLIANYAIDKNLVSKLRFNNLNGSGKVQYGYLSQNNGYIIESNKFITEFGVSSLQTLANYWGNYISNQNTIDKYNKYFISYAVRMNSTENLSKTFNVIVNNHVYNLAITMPTAQIAEYLLGGVYLNSIGYETVFVDKSYTGFFDLNYNGNSNIKLPDGTAEGGKVEFKTINNFINNLANITVKAYFNSNLYNLTDANHNNETLNSLYYYKDLSTNNTYKLSANNVNEYSKSYLQLLLKAIVDMGYLSAETYKAVLVSSSVPNSDNVDCGNKVSLNNYIDSLNKEQAEAAFDSVISYLTGRNRHYSYLTSKQLRNQLIDSLINYNQDSGATAKQNRARYLALFNLICTDIVEKQEPILDSNNNPLISVRAELDLTSKNLILSLVGLSDKPEENLVGLEYTLLNTFDGYDENNGDYFIICTYDNVSGKYVPFLMTNYDNGRGFVSVPKEDNPSSSETWLTKYKYGICKTYYYTSEYLDENGNSKPVSFPIIAKGIITEDGYPTAIRQVNGVTEFYRSNIVIRNASKLGLSAYYMSTEQISVNYNLVSAFTNSISKIFTGKTLVEHVYGNIPRFEIDSRISLPMGVDNYTLKTTQAGITLDYGFNNLSGLSISNFYILTKIDYLILLIAIVALMPIVFKAVWGVIGRVIDITIYYIMSPVMFATISLGKDVTEKKETTEKTPIFSQWYKDLTKKTLSVFGYVVGFQIFFILIPFIGNMTFISDVSFFNSLANLSSIGVNVVNQIIRLIFLICSAYLINEAPELFSKILSQNNGFKDSEEIKKNVDSIKGEVMETLTGQHVINTINYAQQSIKDLTGISAAQEVYGQVKKVGASVASRGAEVYLRAHGVPKDVAKKLTKEYRNSVKQEVDAKRMLREEKSLKAQDAFNQQVGADYEDEDYAKRLAEIDNILSGEDKKSPYKGNKQIKLGSNANHWLDVLEDRKKANKKKKKK